MSSIITGNAAAVTTPLTATISAATNATPIVITSTSNHFFATGDSVFVSGVLGNTNANGLWTIIVTGATTFSLTGSTGNAAYTSGGTAKDLSLSPQFTIPSDGDAPSAASVNVGFQTLADRTSFLNLRSSPLPSLAALAQILAPTDGMVRVVRGQGTFVFDSSATATFSPWTVAPIDLTTGQWVSATAHQTSLTRYVPCSHVRAVALNGSTAGQVLVTNNPTWGSPLSTVALVGSTGLYPVVVYSGATANTAYGFLLPLDPFLVQGCTLATATLALRPTGGHAALPLTQPQLAICRVTSLGLAPVPDHLLSTGFVQTAAGSTVAYQTDLTLALTTNQFNVIDNTSYSYFAIIFDEGGTNSVAGNRFAGLTLSMTNIPDARR